jgi:hypothetical protein
VEQLGIGDLLANLWQLLVAFGKVLYNLLIVGLHWLLLIVWVAWWLWGVNWRRAWPVLAAGAWVPVALLAVVAALVWSQLDHGPLSLRLLPGTDPVQIANFWWQLGAVALLAAIALFCGWLQGVFGWAPQEVSFELPDIDDTHGHEHPVGTLHGHDAAHADEPQ